MAAAAMRNSPEIANGGYHPQNINEPSTALGSHKYYAEDSNSEAIAEQGSSRPQKTKSKSKSTPKAGSTQDPHGRSFSARARDANMDYTIDEPELEIPSGLKKESTTPRGLPPSSYAPETGADTPEDEEPMSSPPPDASTTARVQSPPSRSNTIRSTSSQQRRDWASDRSPLQKLEVTLNGISKEEKRARVQEAEMRLRERMARQKMEREQAEAAATAAATAAAAASVPRPSSKQRSQPENRRPSGTARDRGGRDVIAQDIIRDAPPNPRQPRNAPARHNRNVSMNPQFSVTHRPEENVQYPRAELPVPSSAKMGTVPRRPVTMSGPVAKPELARGDTKHSRSVSQQGPAKPHQAVIPQATVPAAAAALTADAISSEDRLDTPPAAPAAQESVESHSRPKKPNVSFNVPPPTPPPVFEWKNAPPAHLGVADFDFQNLDMDRSKAWWEGGGTKNRRKSRALPKNYQTPAQKLTGKMAHQVNYPKQKAKPTPGVTQHKNFEPKLFLRCGPLLRYTGIKKTSAEATQGIVDKETWRGSILIVTKDSRSSYETPPDTASILPANGSSPSPACRSQQGGWCPARSRVY